MIQTDVLNVRLSRAEKDALSIMVAERNYQLTAQGEVPTTTTSTLVRELLRERAALMGIPISEPVPEPTPIRKPKEPPKGRGYVASRRTRKAVVYFIQSTGPSGVIKIGTTVNLEQRFNGLQSAHPVPLKLLLALPGNETLEGNLHAMFAHVRTRGEWFLPDPSLLEFIASHRPRA